MMPYKDKAMKSQRQKERRKGEAPPSEAPVVEAPEFTPMSWEEQQRRFPDIPLPFGPAYYKALAEQELKIR